MSKSQSQLILKHLENGNTITPLEALNLFGSFRLSARIHDIKALGHDIETKNVTRGGKTFAEYSLIKKGKICIKN